MTMKPKILEKHITADIRKFLNFKHVFHWKQWQGPMSSMPGVSDILGIFRGRFLAIEVKKPGGKLTEKQQEFIDRINANGGIAFVARDVFDVIETLFPEEKR